MGGTCHWTRRSACRDCHDAHAGWPRPARAVPLCHPACRRGSPERPSEFSRLPTDHVRVDDIDETLERLRKRGAQLVGEVVRYQEAYRLCYIRGPEGLLIGLAQELS